ncbi:MAG: F0F1 ATP synthase subunit alpha, partial [Alphaproteobacteria bacterium]|nr:F0F1 ATP synthase subunit alpha [Alphaproteobacteria bacterium]
MNKSEETFEAINKTIAEMKADFEKEEVSIIKSISAGTAVVGGLENVQMEELLDFPHNVKGMVQTLNEDSVGVVFLDNPEALKAGDRVRRSKRVLDVPVTESLL